MWLLSFRKSNFVFTTIFLLRMECAPKTCFCPTIRWVLFQQKIRKHLVLHILDATHLFVGQRHPIQLDTLKKVVENTVAFVDGEGFFDSVWIPVHFSCILHAFSCVIFMHFHVHFACRFAPWVQSPSANHRPAHQTRPKNHQISTAPQRHS